MRSKGEAAHIISQAEMARLLGVSRPAVSQACRPGGRLESAREGKGVNVLHPAARHWQAQRDAAAKGPPVLTVAKPASSKAGKAAAPPGPPVAVDDDPPEAPARPKSELELELGARGMVDLADLAEPLTTLTERYGDAPNFEKWLRARKMLEEALKAQMLRERIAGRLIARTTVDHMVGHVFAAFELLLNDAPRTIAARLKPDDMVGAITLVRDTMTQILTGSRDQMAAAMLADDPMAPLLEAAE